MSTHTSPHVGIKFNDNNTSTLDRHKLSLHTRDWLFSWTLIPFSLWVFPSGEYPECPLQSVFNVSLFLVISFNGNWHKTEANPATEQGLGNDRAPFPFCYLCLST